MRINKFIFFLLVSIALHILLLVCFILSKGLNFMHIPPQENVIFMHVLPVADINNVKTRQQKQSQLPDNEKSKKVDTNSQASQKLDDNSADLKKEQPEIEAKPEAVKEDVKPDDVAPEKATEPTAPKETPKLPPKEKPVLKKKIMPKDKELDLNSLEKSLQNSANDKNKEKPSEGVENKSNKKSGGKNQDDQTSSSDNYNAESPESISATTLLRSRIESNWLKPPSMRDYENVKIKVRLKLDINQGVQEISGFEFFNEAVPENVKSAIKESISRAIKLSEPFEMLSLEHYNHWHENILIFGYK
jgi:outer membrane biosynthesis protein TonB